MDIKNLLVNKKPGPQPDEPRTSATTQSRSQDTNPTGLLVRGNAVTVQNVAPRNSLIPGSSANLGGAASSSSAPQPAVVSQQGFSFGSYTLHSSANVTAMNALLDSRPRPHEQHRSDYAKFLWLLETARPSLPNSTVRVSDVALFRALDRTQRASLVDGLVLDGSLGAHARSAVNRNEDLGRRVASTRPSVRERSMPNDPVNRQAARMLDSLSDLKGHDERFYRKFLRFLEGPNAKDAHGRNIATIVNFRRLPEAQRDSLLARWDLGRLLPNGTPTAVRRVEGKIADMTSSTQTTG